MRRTEAEGGRKVERTPPPLVSHSLPTRHLYIHDASRTTKSTARIEDNSKLGSLRSVSPTSSTHELTMRSWHSHSSDDHDQSAHDDVHLSERRRLPPSNTTPALLPTSKPTTTQSTKGQVFDDASRTDELQYIKESVERLRTQRTHVEQLRERNARLEMLLTDRAKENEKLRRHIAAMQGVEQENVTLLHSFQLLEERIRALETTCHDRIEAARVANDRLAAMETARSTLLRRVDELAIEREHIRKQLSTAQSVHDKRIHELQTSHARALENYERGKSEWQRKALELENAQSNVEQRFQDELVQRQREHQELVEENTAMEQHVQQLLATTVRQTTMIEDCDRLLRESTSRHESAKAKYRDQLRLTANLQAQLQQLELKLSTAEQGFIQEKKLLETKRVELEVKARKLKDKNAMYVVALQEKENHNEKLQNELLVRDRARSHAEDVVKELRHKEKTVLSEISSLRVAVTDLTDEKSILQDQLASLHEQLEKERRDRSRWATARLKLLAEFCDEENKLSTALHQYPGMEVLTEDGLEEEEEEVDEEVFDDKDDGEGDVDPAVVGGAGLKMDALNRRIHNRTSTHGKGNQQSMRSSKSIVFG